MRKKLFASLLILISLVGISWFFFYEYSVRALEKSLIQIELNLKKKGYTISYSKVEISGTPLLLRVVLQNPHLKDPRGLIEWQGPEMEIQIYPWEFHTLSCTFPGDHKVVIPQTTPIPLGDLLFQGTKGIFTLSSQGVLEEAHITVDRISSLLGTQSQPVFLKETSVRLKNVRDLSNLSLSFMTEIFHIEKVLNLHSFDHPFTLELEAKFSGYEPKSFPTTLGEWRDGGGVIDVTHLKILWPPMNILAEGTLTLDNEMYPLGSFSSTIFAYQDTLADMVKLGWVKKKNAKTVSFMLDLFSVPDETYGRKLTVPITLQNKTLSIGPAPLLKLRPLKDF